MKLLVQGDDFGFTKGVTYGIVEAIDNGILRNTGLFTNMPSSAFAAGFMKDRPQACFGIDFNIVSGRPVSDPSMVPSLVDENGEFVRSKVRVKDPRFATEEGRKEMFPYSEVYTELKAQYDRFLELTDGKKPGYLHGHSLSHENYRAAIAEISKATGIPYSQDMAEKYNMGSTMKKKFMAGMIKKEFDPIAQLNKNTIEQVLSCSDELLSHEYAMIGGHPGYVDAELLELTTLSLERCKDLQMCCSDEMKKWIAENHIQLITYYDLY
ncbi:MAG: ChbG/HpnK family deacetylase [Erysipelotrichia bacterium]|nr:ChbG/HpnK family deacetylase [Erysipelotrichia bacterium]